MVIPMLTEGAIPMLGSRMNNASNVPPPSPDYAPQMGSPFGGPGNDGPLPF